MRYFALTDPYDGIDTCKSIIRIGDGLPERYTNGEWVEDVELLGVYCGDIESTPLTDQQAEALIRRLQ